MTIEQAAEVVITFFSLALLWILYAWLYKGYIVDLYRQKMFILRDQLFDEALEGLISFDHPAYGTLRNAMNGYIRFAHRINLMDGLLLSIVSIWKKDFIESQTGSFDKKIELETKDLDEHTRQRLSWYRNKVYRQINAHCFFVSPFFYLTTVAAMVILSIWSLVTDSLDNKESRNILRYNINNIESAAYATGRI